MAERSLYGRQAVYGGLVADKRYHHAAAPHKTAILHLPTTFAPPRCADRMITDHDRATVVLPVDVLTLCFELLPTRAIFTVLPLVCKQWRNLLAPIQKVHAMGVTCA